MRRRATPSATPSRPLGPHSDPTRSCNVGAMSKCGRNTTFYVGTNFPLFPPRDDSLATPRDPSRPPRFGRLPAIAGPWLKRLVGYRRRRPVFGFKGHLWR